MGKKYVLSTISAMAQTHILTKWQTCLQQRSTLSISPLSLDMWVLLSTVEYVNPPNVPALITVPASVACRDRVEEIPTDACYTDWFCRGNLST